MCEEGTHSARAEVMRVEDDVLVKVARFLLGAPVIQHWGGSWGMRS